MSLSMVHSQKSTIGRANVVQKLMRGLSTVAPGLAAMAAEQLFVTVVRHKVATSARGGLGRGRHQGIDPIAAR